MKPNHPPIYFNGKEVVAKTGQKHLAFILDKQLNFNAHLKEVIGKAKRGIGVIKFISKCVTRNVLDQMYKLYVRPHLDYGDVLYHQYDPNFSLSLTTVLESVQYSAALVVTGAWRGTNTDKLYEELEWESLCHRRYYRRMTLFYKIVNGCTPEYSRAPINLARVKPHSFRNSNVLEPINSRTNQFASSFYPFCVREWNNFELSLRVLPSISQFKTAIIRIIRPSKDRYIVDRYIEFQAQPC